MTKTIKKRKFKVASGLTPDAVAAATDRLQHYPGVVSVSSDGRHITIQYALRDCSYAIITRFLAELQLPVATGGKVEQMKADWIMFTEENELANLALPAGWPQHVQNLYLSLHASNRTLTR